jgi:hypothetical protein
VISASENPAPSTQHITDATFLPDEKADYRFGLASGAALDAIPRPRSEAGAIASIAKIWKQELAFVRENIAAYERGTAAGDAWQAANESKAVALNSLFNSLARSVGARICAENPVPSGAGVTIA